jgi:hypothetical protein
MSCAASPAAQTEILSVFQSNIQLRDDVPARSAAFFANDFEGRDHFDAASC